jgi:hypothetical protein
MHDNREKKKPKQDKKAPPPASPFASQDAKLKDAP